MVPCHSRLGFLQVRCVLQAWHPLSSLPSRHVVHLSHGFHLPSSPIMDASRASSRQPPQESPSTTPFRQQRQMTIQGQSELILRSFQPRPLCGINNGCPGSRDSPLVYPIPISPAPASPHNADHMESGLQGTTSHEHTEVWEAEDIPRNAGQGFLNLQHC